jgi:hypothetical protein
VLDIKVTQKVVLIHGESRPNPYWLLLMALLPSILNAFVDGQVADHVVNFKTMTQAYTIAPILCGTPLFIPIGLQCYGGHLFARDYLNYRILVFNDHPSVGTLVPIASSFMRPGCGDERKTGTVLWGGKARKREYVGRLAMDNTLMGVVSMWPIRSTIAS